VIRRCPGQRPTRAPRPGWDRFAGPDVSGSVLDAERSALTRLLCPTNSVNAFHKVPAFFLVCPHRGATEPRPVGNNLAGAWTAPWPACWTMSMSASRPADDPNAAATVVHGGLGLTPERRGATAPTTLRLCATFRGFCHPSSHLW